MCVVNGLLPRKHVCIYTFLLTIAQDYLKTILTNEGGAVLLFRIGSFSVLCVSVCSCYMLLLLLLSISALLLLLRLL